VVKKSAAISKWMHRAFAMGDLTEKERTRLFDLAQKERDRELYEIEGEESEF